MHDGTRFLLYILEENFKQTYYYPQIYANSKTRVSEIIREVIRGGNFSGAVPSMTGRHPFSKAYQ